MGLQKVKVIFTLILFISTVRCIYKAYTADPERDYFPYQAFIVVVDSENKSIRTCSGVVIDPLFVMTTLSCVKNGVWFRIILGTFKPEHAVYDHVTHVKPYINTEPNVMSNSGLALLLLEKEVIYSSSIQPGRVVGK